LPQFLELELSSELAGSLFRKKQEYATRGTVSAAHNKAVLEILLNSGIIDVLTAVVVTKEQLKQDFNLSDFEIAWIVLDGYINDPSSLSGGTGLPR